MCCKWFIFHSICSIKVWTTSGQAFFNVVAISIFNLSIAISIHTNYMSDMNGTRLHCQFATIYSDTTYCTLATETFVDGRFISGYGVAIKSINGYVMQPSQSGL